MTNVLRLTILLILTSATTFIQSTFAASISIHGTVCQPANLNQALALGLGWSQIGAANNAPLGSSPFFITCPIISEGSTVITTTNVSTEKLNPAAIQPTCTIFRQTFFSTALTTNDIPVVLTTPPLTHLQQVIDIPYNTDSGDSLNIICAVFPQTRIREIVIFDDL